MAAKGYSRHWAVVTCSQCRCADGRVEYLSASSQWMVLRRRIPSTDLGLGPDPSIPCNYRGMKEFCCSSSQPLVDAGVWDPRGSGESCARCPGAGEPVSLGIGNASTVADVSGTRRQSFAVHGKTPRSARGKPPGICPISYVSKICFRSAGCSDATHRRQSWVVHTVRGHGESAH